MKHPPQQIDTTVIGIHASLKGRARFHVPALHREADLEERLISTLCSMAGMHDVRPNPVTGNVLVLFDEGMSPESVARSLRSALKNLGNPEAFRGRFPDGWHRMSADSALRKLGTSPRGLSPREVQSRLSRFGRNRLSDHERRSDLRIFVSQFRNFPVALLSGSALLSVVTGGALDAAVIMSVVLINAGVGFFTERQVEETVFSLERDTRTRSKVVRSRRITTVDMEEIVPGDILLLERGDIVPADTRLLRTEYFTVDESSLTGESVSVEKSTTTVSSKSAPLAERRNMAYRDTVVTGGKAMGVAVSTGASTEIGAIQKMMGLARSPKTPIQRELDDLGRRAVILSLGLCGAVFVIGFFRGYRFLEMLRTSVSLAVAAIPEGLPAVATTTLAQGVSELKEKGILIRRLETLEALGSVHVICLDKTGTLTRNELRAVRFVTASAVFGDVEGDSPELRKLLQITAICSDTKVVRPPEGNAPAVLEGSPTENALVHAAFEAGIDVEALRARHAVRGKRHRTERRSYMVAELDGDPEFAQAVKGQPETVLRKCTHVLDGARTRPLTEALRRNLRDANNRLAGESLRVLGVAYTDRSSLAHEKRVFVGFSGLRDVMRPGADTLTEALQQAGVQSMILTGDQRRTAEAIAHELGLDTRPDAAPLDSATLERMSLREISDAISHITVLSRVSPAHKMRIVQALQEAGRVVAMTGDGINDGPALKAADIGLAMSGNGKAAAKRVADMILLEDRIEDIIAAIEKGRTISDDIRKSIEFILATNFAEMLIPLVSLAAGFGSPLNPMQLLWINVLTDIFPELALALEPPEAGILSRPPRELHEPIVPGRDYSKLLVQGGAISVSALASYTYGYLRYGAGAHANTLAFVGLISTQLLHALSTRSDRHSVFDGILNARKKRPLPRNPHLERAIYGSFLTEGLAVTVPAFRKMLNTSPLRPADLAATGGGALASYLFNEIFKALREEHPIEGGNEHAA